MAFKIINPNIRPGSTVDGPRNPANQLVANPDFFHQQYQPCSEDWEV